MLQQLIYCIGGLFSIPFLPILMYLGKKTKRKVPSLGEATENIISQVGNYPTHLNLLTLGESTIAGVGVTSHNDGVTGATATHLSHNFEKTVHWQVIAKNGYTAERVTQKLVPQIPQMPFDFIVIGMGGNDTFQLNSPLTFKKNMILMLENIQVTQPNAQIIIINMPPVADFPAFPWLIQFLLGGLVSLHGKVIADLPSQFKNVYYISNKIRLKDWIPKDKSLTAKDFFSDGVHPSSLTYKMWGNQIGDFITKNCAKH